MQSDVAAVVQDAARVFEGLGHTLVDMRLDERSAPPDLAAYWGLLGSWEAAAELAPLLKEREADFARSFLEGLRWASGLTPAWWGEMARARQATVAWCARAFAEHDLLLMPTVPYDPPPARGPFPAETEGRRQTTASVASFTIPFNMSWHPAASVRAGLSRAGLPVGLQIVGPMHREDLVLRAARAFERARPWHAAWPLRG